MVSSTATVHPFTSSSSKSLDENMRYFRASEALDALFTKPMLIPFFTMTADADLKNLDIVTANFPSASRSFAFP